MCQVDCEAVTVTESTESGAVEGCSVKYAAIGLQGAEHKMPFWGQFVKIVALRQVHVTVLYVL